MDEEELKQMKKTLDELSTKIDDKIGELSKTAGKTVENKKEYIEHNIKENSLAYMAGAFVGGMIVGYI